MPHHPVEVILGNKTYLLDIAQAIFWSCVFVFYFYMKKRENVSYLEAVKYVVGVKKFKHDMYTIGLTVIAFGGVFGLIMYGNFTRGNI